MKRFYDWIEYSLIAIVLGVAGYWLSTASVSCASVGAAEVVWPDTIPDRDVAEYYVASTGLIAIDTLENGDILTRERRVMARKVRVTILDVPVRLDKEGLDLALLIVGRYAVNRDSTYLVKTVNEAVKKGRLQ